MLRRIPWHPVSALLVISLAGCQGKVTPKREPEPRQAEAADAEPAEKKTQGAQERAPERAYSGSIEAELDGAPKRFDVVAEEKTHLVHAGKMRSMVFIARPAPDVTEQLVVVLRGHEFTRVVGKTLPPGHGRGAKLPRIASVAYIDDQGVRFTGSVGKDVFDLRVTAYERDAFIEGTFSGTLQERKGERTIKVQNGKFGMRLDPPGS